MIASAPPPARADTFDSFVLCELARTDAHRFPALAPSGDETMALRALVRTREDLVAARVGLANQLRAQLDGFWPGAARSSPTSTARSRWRSWSATPPRPTRAAWDPSACTPSSPATPTAAGARPASCSSACAARPRPSSANSKPTPAAPPSLGLVCRAAPDRRPDQRAHQPDPRRHPRATPTARSSCRFFRDPKSGITAAGLLAEIGDNRARYPHRDALAADAGQAPVAIESGKRRTAAFRWACDKRLRNHSAVLADSTRHWHPWAPDLYQRARARGATTPTPSASSAAPGPASSGAAGKTTSPTTPPNTERPHATSHTRVDTGRLTPGQPAEQPAQHGPELGRERHAGCQADHDAQRQADHRADCDGGARAASMTAGAGHSQAGRL